MASMNYFPFVCTLLLVSTQQLALSETVITLESPEDGFECFEGEVESTNCQLNSLTSPHDLPSNFPSSYHSLDGNNFMFATSSNDSIMDIGLVTAGLPINFGDNLMITAEYYTETIRSIGYIIWGDSGFGFFEPTSNSTWKLGHSKYVIKAADYVLMISLASNNDRFVVFRKITIIINPDPTMDIEIKEAADFERYGIPCPDCTIASVNSSQQLPSAYPDGFRNLSLDSAESIMFVIPNNSSGAYELFVADLANETTLSCAGYVELEGEFYVERVLMFGYGLTNGGWRSLGTSEPSTWTPVERTLFDIKYYLMQGNRKVGFYSEAEGRSVFKRLRAKIYWYPQPELGCNFKSGEEPISLADAPEDHHPLIHLFRHMRK